MAALGAFPSSSTMMAGSNPTSSSASCSPPATPRRAHLRRCVPYARQVFGGMPARKTRYLFPASVPVPIFVPVPAVFPDVYVAASPTFPFPSPVPCPNPDEAAKVYRNRNRQVLRFEVRLCQPSLCASVNTECDDHRG